MTRNFNTLTSVSLSCYGSHLQRKMHLSQCKQAACRHIFPALPAWTSWNYFRGSPVGGALNVNKYGRAHETNADVTANSFSLANILLKMLQKFGKIFIVRPTGPWYDWDCAIWYVKRPKAQWRSLDWTLIHPGFLYSWFKEFNGNQ